MTSPTNPGKRVLMLLTDGYGGFGGVAQYNRDVVEALDGLSEIAEIEALSRIADADTGPMPAKYRHNLSGLGGAARFAVAALRRGIFGPRPGLVLCAHVNLIGIAWIIAAIRRVPLMLVTYGVDVWQAPSSWLGRKGTKASKIIVSISQYTADRMAAWHGFAPGQLHLWPNAIRPEDYGIAPPSADLVARYGLAGKRVIMTLGRLDAREKAKGFDQILDAMPRLRERHPDLVYLIAGRGDDRERLEAKVQALGLADCVVFTGEVEEARKADHYRLATAYVMPSKGEGFGFVFLEALACGVPVVAGRYDGGYDAILRGELGIAVDPQNQDELVAAIERALGVPHVIPVRLHDFAFPAFQQRLRESIATLTRS
jgi:phosphatidyl-myo-inositol dimannoside synthase